MTATATTSAAVSPAEPLFPTAAAFMRQTPDAIVAALLARNIWAFSITYHPAVSGPLGRARGAGVFMPARVGQGQFYASHAAVANLIPWLEEDMLAGRDFDKHEGIFVSVGRKSRVLMSAFVYNTVRGPGAGGVRHCIYDTVESLFRDGLRLSRGMAQKTALAGIWWGGAKGCMARNSGTGLSSTDDAAARQVVFEEYGEFITQLKGCFVTAGDAGVNRPDMIHLYSRTRFATTIPRSLGGSGSPAPPTARGVLRGLEAAFTFLAEQSGMDAKMGPELLRKATVLVQGFGHVGSHLVHDLVHLAGVKKVVVAHVEVEKILPGIDRVKAYPADRVEFVSVPRGDHMVLAMPGVDAVCPCATGGGLNAETVPKIQAKIVCGAANNQLLDVKTTADTLAARGIIYVPDFLVNRMGIVHCADEAAGYIVPDDDLLLRHLGYDWEQSIYNTTLRVLRMATVARDTTQAIALREADARMKEPHPIWGHRGAKIIAGLVHGDDWVQYAQGEGMVDEE
ncbi:hypothetical protein GGF32_005233 [Allomyces javanicus]|nr:hypothetical protein GGF32_005233 [Allomyces javanicus]